MKDYFLVIEDYIEGILSDAEKIDFEKEMSQNTSLAKAVENFPVAKKIASSIIEEELHKELEKIKNQKQPAKTRNLRHITTIAASFLLLITLTSAHFYSKTNYSNEALAEKFYQMPVYDGERNGEDVPEDSLEMAKYYFQLADFNRSFDLLKSLESRNVQDEDLTRYLGHSYLLKKDYEQAIPYFLNATDERDQYALALAYLGNGNEAKAKELLESTNNDLELKGKLNSFWRKLH